MGNTIWPQERIVGTVNAKEINIDLYSKRAFILLMEAFIIITPITIMPPIIIMPYNNYSPSFKSKLFLIQSSKLTLYFLIISIIQNLAIIF